MAEAVLDIKQWGNSLGMRLPSVVAKAAHLHLDQRVRLVVEEGRIIIIPLNNEMDTLEQRLEKFDCVHDEGEVMQVTSPTGVEVW